jgi:hypothetical protein
VTGKVRTFFFSFILSYQFYLVTRFKAFFNCSSKSNCLECLRKSNLNLKKKTPPKNLGSVTPAFFGFRLLSSSFFFLLMLINVIYDECVWLTLIAPSKALRQHMRVYTNFYTPLISANNTINYNFCSTSDDRKKKLELSKSDSWYCWRFFTFPQPGAISARRNFIDYVDTFSNNSTLNMFVYCALFAFSFLSSLHFSCSRCGVEFTISI